MLYGTLGGAAGVAADAAAIGRTTASGALGRGVASSAEEGGAAGLCFAAGTMVLTDTGEKQIEEIAVGDLVISRDTLRSMTVLKPVVQLFRNHDKQFLDVGFDRNGDIETIAVTPEHPFFVLERGWVPAGKLVPGDLVQGHASGEGLAGALLVRAVTAHSGREDSYNFEVADTPTYFVGRLGALVHNTCSANTSGLRS